MALRLAAMSLLRCCLKWFRAFHFPFPPLFGLGIRIHYVFNLSIKCLFFALKNSPRMAGPVWLS